MNDKMTLAAPSFHFVDVWNAGKFDLPSMKAYRKLMDTHLIELIKVHVNRGSGMIAVDYMSSLPYEWTLDALRAARDENLKRRIHGAE